MKFIISRSHLFPTYPDFILELTLWKIW